MLLWLQTSGHTLTWQKGQVSCLRPLFQDSIPLRKPLLSWPNQLSKSHLLPPSPLWVLDFQHLNFQCGQRMRPQRTNKLLTGRFFTSQHAILNGQTNYEFLFCNLITINMCKLILSHSLLCFSCKRAHDLNLLLSLSIAPLQMVS